MSHKSYRQADCGIAAALEVVGDRWTLLIVRELMKGNRRFNELQNALPGLAPNLLSARLKLLAEAGVVQRVAFREIPPRVEYYLTDLGVELRPVLMELLRWGNHFVQPTTHAAKMGPASVGLDSTAARGPLGPSAG